MPDIRFCLDCSSVGELTQHGRCSCCDSNAVVLAESMNAWEPPGHDETWDVRQRNEIMELESLFRLTANSGDFRNSCAPEPSLPRRYAGIQGQPWPSTSG